MEIYLLRPRNESATSSADGLYTKAILCTIIHTWGVPYLTYIT
jgi:hypothetical protein